MNSDELNGHVSGLELSHLAFAAYPFSFMPLNDNIISNWLPNRSDGDEGGDCKRLKRTHSLPETFFSNAGLFHSGSGGITRSRSTGDLPQLRFRDHILAYTRRYQAAEAMEEAVAALSGSDDSSSDEDKTEDGTQLVQLLVSCAEAVACRDKPHASALLAKLRGHALVFGSAFQRVASCFVQGLTDRLALVQSVGFVTPMPNLTEMVSDKRDEALGLVYEICPYIKFGHLVANSAILEAFEGESFVHVVDLGMTLGLPDGHQWRRLLESLAARSGGPPSRLRITAIGPNVGHFQVIGYGLEDYAMSLGINMEFFVLETNLENLRAEQIKTTKEEVLVVNSILQLHCVVKESRGALNSVLKRIRGLSPRVLVLVEQDSGHNGPFFLGRFMEALHYYSAIFDSLDSMLPKYDTKRAKMEQFFYAEEIKNIISCEGPARVERHERVDQWRRRMSRAGFQPGPIKILAQAKQWLSEINACVGYIIEEEKGCLVLGWKSRPIIAASCWKC